METRIPGTARVRGRAYSGALARALLIGAVMLFAAPAVATAQLRVCNQTTDRVVVAVGDTRATSGARRLVSGPSGPVRQCGRRKLAEPLLLLSRARLECGSGVERQLLVLRGERAVHDRWRPRVRSPWLQAPGFRRLDTGDSVSVTRFASRARTAAWRSCLASLRARSVWKGRYERLHPPSSPYADSIVPKDYDASGAWADVGDW